MALANLARRFGQEVRARRASRGITQARLAEAANLSEEWVRKIERGDGAPSLETIEALARGLKVEVASLFAASDAEARQRDRISALLCDLDEVSRCGPFLGLWASFHLHGPQGACLSS